MLSSSDDRHRTSDLSAGTAAIAAASRLMEAAAGEDGGAARVLDALVVEARGLLDVPAGVLFALEGQGPARRASLVGAAAKGFPVADVPALAELCERRLRSLRADGATAAAVAARAGLPAREPGSVLLLGVPGGQPSHVLLLADADPAAFPPDAVAAAEALVAAGAAALAHSHDVEAAARRAAEHEALTRAAKVLHETLDLPTVLNRICEEATRILDGDYTAVYRGARDDGVGIAAAYGLPPELVGFRLEPGQGLSGKVLTSGRPMLTNDYSRIANLPPDSPFADVRSCIAVPMRWGGELRGVITVGYQRAFRVTAEHLRLLETFAELAALACSNASAHAGLALAARTDGLTGCLNHAALHEGLRREIERAERASTGSLSLIMVDLDDFKSVNERHGHLVGDEVLRRAGHALRQATRPYDIAARYGGDEFALVAVEADEAAAEEIARRTVERITLAIGDLCEGDAGRATAGIAEWRPGLGATELVARADRALLYGKHEGGRGQTVLFSELPEWFRPGRFARRGVEAPPVLPPSPPRASAPDWPEPARPAEERLRDRTRRLAHASALGTRLVGMAEPQRIVATAADELGRALDAACTVLSVSGSGLVRAAGASLDDASLASRCLEEERPLLQTDAAAPARLAVPLLVDEAQWGALEVVAAKPGSLDADDLRLAEDVARHTGAALHAALRYAALRLAYDEAVAALADRTPSPG